MTLVDELRQTFLFESLTEEQLQVLAAAGSEVAVEAGESVTIEGEPADFLWVLLDGELELSRLVSGQRIVLLTASRKGTYVGVARAFGDSTYTGYRVTTRALRASRLFRLPWFELSRLLWEWFPMAKHLLDGILQTASWIDNMVRQREALVALGTMAAGLAHELNNPAAAAARASAELRSTMRALQQGLQELAGSGLDPHQLQMIFTLQTEAVSMAHDNPPGDPLAVADREEEIADWLQEHGLDEGWKLAPTFVGAGVDLAWLDHAAQKVGAQALGPGLRWIGCTLTASSLLDQLDDATRRISGLVRAVKEYTYMDRAPVQEVDLQAELDNTLLMLGHKINQGVEVTKEYDPALPRIEAYGSELNQVWLNLLDNAVDAAGESGRVRIRTAVDGDRVLVEVADNGPGVPEEIQRRIFEPFFTTKEPGKGTGMGLDIARRIVVDRHGGDLTLESTPGDTRFLVRLPIKLTAGKT